jgi:hypothetical protein
LVLLSLQLSLSLCLLLLLLDDGAELLPSARFATTHEAENDIRSHPRASEDEQRCDELCTE